MKYLLILAVCILTSCAGFLDHANTMYDDDCVVKYERIMDKNLKTTGYIRREICN